MQWSTCRLWRQIYFTFGKSMVVRQEKEFNKILSARAFSSHLLICRVSPRISHPHSTQSSSSQTILNRLGPESFYHSYHHHHLVFLISQQHTACPAFNQHTIHHHSPRRCHNVRCRTRRIRRPPPLFRPRLRDPHGLRRRRTRSRRAGNTGRGDYYGGGGGFRVGCLCEGV